MIRFVCWNCGKSLKAQPANAGKKCRCNACDELNTIPSHGIEAVTEAESAPQPAPTPQFEASRPPQQEYFPEFEVTPGPPVFNRVPPKTNDHGKVFCYKCGASIFEEAEICPHCGVRQKRSQPYAFQSAYQRASSDGPNKVVAALLAFFLGMIGAHKFYLGQIGMGVVYLLIGTVGWILFWFILFIPQVILAVVCLIEAIMYLSMSDADFAAKYSR